METEKILIYGYGNPGRGDDGLGIALCSEIEKLADPRVTVETNYQLNIEDADLMKDHDTVLFVDASCNPIEAYRLQRLEPSQNIEFTTHAMAPGSVLTLCRELYGRSPASFVLEIGGTAWDLGAPISGRAAENLRRACAFVVACLSRPQSFAAALEIAVA